MTLFALTRRLLGARPLAAALLGGMLSLGAHAQTLKIGVTPGALADSIHVAAQEAKKQGLDVKVIEFTDWTTPNSALISGDIDVNYFQHQAFLDNAIKERQWKLQSVAVGILPNIGLYSYRVKRLEDLKEGARVGVVNDPVNQGRGLLLLQQAGLIKLRDGVGPRGTVNDLIANPRKLKLIEVEGPQLVRAIDDLDLAQGYPAHFVNAGKPEVAGSALLYSGLADEHYAVREQILKSYAGNARLYSLPWLGKS